MLHHWVILIAPPAGDSYKHTWKTSCKALYIGQNWHKTQHYGIDHWHSRHFNCTRAQCARKGRSMLLILLLLLKRRFQNTSFPFHRVKSPSCRPVAVPKILKYFQPDGQFIPCSDHANLYSTPTQKYTHKNMRHMMWLALVNRVFVPTLHKCVVCTAWTYGQRSFARYISDPDRFHPTPVPLHDWAPISNQASDREHPKL